MGKRLQGAGRLRAEPGAEADSIARLGFLEWVFGLGGEATPARARAALASPAAQRPESAAARAFVSFLRQAAQPMTGKVRRGRRRTAH